MHHLQSCRRRMQPVERFVRRSTQWHIPDSIAESLVLHPEQLNF
ncbi:unnamed protein product [Anisakis simplex]|uniref:Transposase n=1 Tax=Anisakis simplex TaxID=6269 RepID=A0A0M3JJR4_ANISI|nr:unnamed protein product [Anisakis simplex]